MADLVYVLVIVGFFGLCVAYVRACDRMIGASDDTPPEPAVEMAEPMEVAS